LARRGTTGWTRRCDMRLVVVMGTRHVSIERGSAAGVTLALAGACVFAYGGFYAARRLSSTPPLAVAAGQ